MLNPVSQHNTVIALPINLNRVDDGWRLIDKSNSSENWSIGRLIIEPDIVERILDVGPVWHRHESINFGDIPLAAPRFAPGDDSLELEPIVEIEVELYHIRKLSIGTDIVILASIDIPLLEVVVVAESACYHQSQEDSQELH